MERSKIPVVDLFAGPGGLGEGFSRFEVGGDRPFEVRLSVEKEEHAHRTLRLRSFYRQFDYGDVPECYYDVLRQRIAAEKLPDRLNGHAGLLEKWDRACRETLCLELGASAHAELRREISARLGQRGAPWVLIGGPPCQAYSIAGRVRNRGKQGYRIEDDRNVCGTLSRSVASSDGSGS